MAVFFYFVCFFIICIWIMPNMFDIVQYRTNPAGIHANIIVNNIGIQRIIRWVWAATSLPDAFVVRGDCRRCCKYMVAPINIGNIKYGSIADKSDIHRKCALRI